MKSFTFWRHWDKKEWLMGVQPQRDKLTIRSFDSSMLNWFFLYWMYIEIFFMLFPTVYHSISKSFSEYVKLIFLYWLLIIEIVHILTSLGQKGVADGGPTATWQADHRLIRFVFSCSFQRYITRYRNNFQSMLNWFFYIDC